MTKEPTDCEKLLERLRALPHGIHSHDIRRWGISGNPSQRIKDLEAKGHRFEKIRENRGKRPGTRYVLLPQYKGAGFKNPKVVYDEEPRDIDMTSSPYLHASTGPEDMVLDQGPGTSEDIERRGVRVESPGNAGLAGNDPPGASPLGAPTQDIERNRGLGTEWARGRSSQPPEGTAASVSLGAPDKPTAPLPAVERPPASSAGTQPSIKRAEVVEGTARYKGKTYEAGESFEFDSDDPWGAEGLPGSKIQFFF